MADNTTKDTAREHLDDQHGVAVDDAAARSLRATVERSEKQLLELESDMEGMLRDHDTIQEDLDQTRALIEGVRSDLQRAQRAIARIDAGAFGTCTGCGGAIAPARLEAIPDAERCSTCA